MQMQKWIGLSQSIGCILLLSCILYKLALNDAWLTFAVCSLVLSVEVCFLVSAMLISVKHDELRLLVGVKIERIKLSDIANIGMDGIFLGVLTRNGRRIEIMNWQIGIASQALINAKKRFDINV